MIMNLGQIILSISYSIPYPFYMIIGLYMGFIIGKIISNREIKKKELQILNSLCKEDFEEFLSLKEKRELKLSEKPKKNIFKNLFEDKKHYSNISIWMLLGMTMIPVVVLFKKVVDNDFDFQIDSFDILRNLILYGLSGLLWGYMYKSSVNREKEDELEWGLSIDEKEKYNSLIEKGESEISIKRQILEGNKKRKIRWIDSKIRKMNDILDYGSWYSKLLIQLIIWSFFILVSVLIFWGFMEIVVLKS